MRVNPAKIIGFQSHLILVGRSRLQVEVVGCTLVCSQCWFAVPDRRNQSRSKNAMIAGPGHFDCRSLHVVELADRCLCEECYELHQSAQRAEEVCPTCGKHDVTDTGLCYVCSNSPEYMPQPDC
ncbi:hypothetical protein ALO48_200190 [Pseudomonas syringae pv. rhaphiolepidis]|nr:hypothetical protein ALO48_200190 [Pseudomonas syringae pv. rhaphiolepidis]